MSKKQIIAMIGAGLLFLGVFAPIVSVPILGDQNYFQNGGGDGVIVLVLAAASVLLVLAKLYRGLWLTGAGSLAVLSFDFFNFLSRMAELRSSMEKDLAGNPFAGLGQAVLGSVQMQWGWAVMMIGACLVIAAPFMREESALDAKDTIVPQLGLQGSALEPISSVPPPAPASRSSNWWVISFAAIGALVFIVLLARNGAPKKEQALLTGEPTDVAETYHESNDIFAPYDLSKNPYKWKGQSGILDTIHVPLIMGNGTRVGQVAYPGGCLKFEKMLDEHTATYSVLVGEGSVVPDGEIAVILPSNDPPDSQRPWRVFVEGPMQAVNGLGATIEISAVRFEGYFVPLTKPVAATPEPQPAPTQEAQNAQAAVDIPSAITPLDMQDPKHISTGNTRLPSQPPIIPEIDQQAITFWNQNRFADAFPLFNQACSGGKMNSCYYLGLMYDFGQGVMQDSSRAAAFYTKACNAGNRAACYHRAMLPQFVPGGCNTGAVIPNLSRSCNMGIATSCSMVGYSYIHGCGVAKNAEKGRQLLIKGCSLGDSNACDGIK